MEKAKKETQLEEEEVSEPFYVPRAFLEFLNSIIFVNHLLQGQALKLPSPQVWLLLVSAVTIWE